MAFNEHANQAHARPQNSTQQHDRHASLVLSIHILGPETGRHGEVHLNGTALPVTANRVFQGVLDLRTVKRPLAFRNLELATGTTQALDQGLLSLVPDGIVTN